jgi:hypothetical protein
MIVYPLYALAQFFFAISTRVGVDDANRHSNACASALLETLQHHTLRHLGAAGAKQCPPGWPPAPAQKVVGFSAFERGNSCACPREGLLWDRTPVLLAGPK